MTASEKFRAFAWTAPKAEAAALLADDELSDVEIARRVGVSDRQLRNWKHHADFAARVQDLADEHERSIQRYRIAKRRHRLARMNGDWERLQEVRAARAVDLADVPGGETGLLVRKPMFVKVYEVKEPDGEDLEDETMFPTGASRVMYEYAVDGGLLKELRDLEKQAAQELGQWSDKHEVAAELKGPVEIHIAPDFLAALGLGATAEATDAGGA